MITGKRGLKVSGRRVAINALADVVGQDIGDIYDVDDAVGIDIVLGIGSSDRDGELVVDRENEGDVAEVENVIGIEVAGSEDDVVPGGGGGIRAGEEIDAAQDLLEVAGSFFVGVVEGGYW